jgi:uncharacterized protein (TIGR04255 family)
MTATQARFRLDFGKLPLIEAAVRATLSAKVPLTYAIVDAIRQRLAPSFPTLTEPQQLEVAPGVGQVILESGPSYLPGAVFTGHARGLSVSVHPQVVVARWVKQYIPAQTTYPRYSQLRDAIWDAVEAFRQGVGDGGFPAISVVNMSYVNFLPVEGPATIRSYLSDEANLPALNRARQIRKHEAAWSEEDSLDVRFALEQVTAKLGGDRLSEGYRLTTAAGFRLAESIDAKSGLERVHDKLQDFFLMLISSRAIEEWELNKVERDD